VGSICHLPRASRALPEKCGNPIGPNRHDFDVLADGAVVGRIFLSSGAPQDRPWMWASERNGDYRRAAHGYEATREAAMAALSKSWRRS
jgi:hypothetical protein